MPDIVFPKEIRLRACVKCTQTGLLRFLQMETVYGSTVHTYIDMHACACLTGIYDVVLTVSIGMTHKRLIAFFHLYLCLGLLVKSLRSEGIEVKCLLISSLQKTRHLRLTMCRAGRFLRGVQSLGFLLEASKAQCSVHELKQ